MRLPSLSKSLFVLSAIAPWLVAAVEGSDVIDLTLDNFDSEVLTANLILVEFFAPWCGHCKALAPEYEDAATKLKEKGIKVAKADCVDNADLCQAQGVSGYPTLKVFRNGTPTDYTGPRRSDGIVSYMIKQSLPAITEVTAENHEEIKEADQVVIIAYVESPTEAPGPVFSEVAEAHRDSYLFGLTSDPAAISQAGVKTPTIVIYKKFDEGRFDITGAAALTVESLSASIKAWSTPLFDEVNGDNYSKYAESGLPLAYLFIDPTDEKRVELIQSLTPIAQAQKGNINFVWIDSTKYVEHAKGLALEPQFPAFVIQDLTSQNKYPLSQDKEVTFELVAPFIGEFLDGKLQPKLKSEPVPETQDEPVYNLVGSKFEEIIFDDSKDVFIEFYAHWCGHCKRLKPIWDELGERYANVKDKITIAKMDATENDLPAGMPFRISGFPTIKFKAAGTRDFIDYDGDRSLEAFVEFVEQKAKNSLVDPSGSSKIEKPVETEAAEQIVVEHDEL